MVAPTSLVLIPLSFRWQPSKVTAAGCLGYKVRQKLRVRALLSKTGLTNHQTLQHGAEQTSITKPVTTQVQVLTPLLPYIPATSKQRSKTTKQAWDVDWCSIQVSKTPTSKDTKAQAHFQHKR